jgi:hypothetical protein
VVAVRGKPIIKIFSIDTKQSLLNMKIVQK